MKFKNSLKSFFDSNLVKKIKKVENTLKIKMNLVPDSKANIRSKKPHVKAASFTTHL